MMELTEKEIRDRLFTVLSPYKNTMAFNTNGVGYYDFEVDVLRVMDSGYCQEFEIKISRADIRKELTKVDKHLAISMGVERTAAYIMTPCPRWPDGLQRVGAIEDTIGDEYPDVHNYKMNVRVRHPVREFYMVLPAELELCEFALSVLPSWAGVIELQGNGRRHQYWDEVVKRKAVKHRDHIRPITMHERVDLHRRMSYKMWDLYYGRGGTGRGGQKTLLLESG